MIQINTVSCSEIKEIKKCYNIPSSFGKEIDMDDGHFCYEPIYCRYIEILIKLLSSSSFIFSGKVSSAIAEEGNAIVDAPEVDIPRH